MEKEILTPKGFAEKSLNILSYALLILMALFASSMQFIFSAIALILSLALNIPLGNMMRNRKKLELKNKINKNKNN